MSVDEIPLEYMDEIQNTFLSLFLCIIIAIKYLFLQLPWQMKFALTV